MSVNPTFEPNQNSGTGKESIPPFFPMLARDGRLPARVSKAQQLLFSSAPRLVCEEMGLNWWAAVKLYEDGWLSFCPESTPRLDEAQEAELRFLGSLVLAGCDRRMLVTLLSSLSKPYAYQIDRLYYDWAAHRWRTLPERHPNPEAVFADWLDTLVENGDVGSLSGILELTHDALGRLRNAAASPRPKP